MNKGEQPVAAQQSTSEDEAVRRLRAAAERGDTTAQTLLSYRLWDGRGVQKNLPQSARWLREGADGGNAMAQVSLGSLYLQGNVEAGLAKDVAQGTEWYRKAVEQGDVTTPSQVSNAADADASLVPEYLGMRASVKRFPGIAAELLGQVYENGGFVPTNYGEAVRWYRRGAKLGYENAQWRLGLMYEHGRRKLPRQVDTAKRDCPADEGLGRNMSGGTRPRLSWGRSLL